MIGTLGVMILAMLAGADGGAATGAGVMGDWVGPTKSVVRIYPCGALACAKIVTLSAASPVTIDEKNPDASLRQRNLCGLDIGMGFRRMDADHLAGGRLYDPKSGRTYSGAIAAKGDELKLRGYVGISLLGRTETWHRAAAGFKPECR